MRIKNFPIAKYCQDNNIKYELHNVDHRRQYYHGYTLFDKEDQRCLVVHETFEKFVGQTAEGFDYCVYNPLTEEMEFTYPKSRKTKLEEVIDYYQYMVRFKNFI